MDAVFKDNSSAADTERMKRVNERIGLTASGNLHHASNTSSVDEEKVNGPGPSGSHLKTQVDGPLSPTST